MGRVKGVKRYVVENKEIVAGGVHPDEDQDRYTYRRVSVPCIILKEYLLKEAEGLLLFISGSLFCVIGNFVL